MMALPELLAPEPIVMPARVDPGFKSVRIADGSADILGRENDL